MKYRDMADAQARVAALRYFMGELERVNNLRPEKWALVHEMAKLIRREAARLATDTRPEND